MALTVGKTRIMGKEKLSDHARSNPWAIVDGGIVAAGRFSTRNAAQQYANRNNPGRNVEVRHCRNGKSWHRRRGSWYSDARLFGAENVDAERRMRVIDA